MMMKQLLSISCFYVMSLVTVWAQATTGVESNNYSYRKALEMKAGKSYLLVAEDNDNLCMAQVPTGSSGFLGVVSVTATNGVISLQDATNAFVFLPADEGHFYLKDSKGRYVCLSGDETQFSLTATLPSSGAVWMLGEEGGPGPAGDGDLPIVGDGETTGGTTVTDGTFKITNLDKQKYIQYSVADSHFEAQATTVGLLPCLYEEILVGDVNRDGELSIADVTSLVNILLGKATEADDSDKYDFLAADVDGDGSRTIADITALVKLLLAQ